MKRKILAIVTAACLVLSMIPGMAFAGASTDLEGDWSGASYDSRAELHSKTSGNNSNYEAYVAKDGVDQKIYYYKIDNAIEYAGTHPGYEVHVIKNSENWLYGKYNKKQTEYDFTGSVKIVGDGDRKTITLLRDLTVNEGVTFELVNIKLIPIAHKRAMDKVNDWAANKTITVKGQLIIDKSSQITTAAYVKENKTFEITTNVEPSGKLYVAGKVEALTDAITINGGETTITGSVSSKNAIVAPGADPETLGITINGGETNAVFPGADPCKLTIGGTKEKPANITGTNTALFLANPQLVTNISGYANLAAKTAIWAKAGALNIDSSPGSVIVLGSAAALTRNDVNHTAYTASKWNEAAATGDAIVIEKNGTNPFVKFTGEINNLIVAAFTSSIANVNKAAAVYPEGQKASFVGTGIYSSDVSAYLMKGYGLTKYSTSTIENLNNITFNGTKVSQIVQNTGIDAVYKVGSAKTDLSTSKVVLSEYVELFDKNGTKKPEVKVFVGGKQLDASEYTVSYEADQSVGKAKVIVEAAGLGNYTGKKVVAYYVKGAPTFENLTNTVNNESNLKYTVKVIGNHFVYNGQEIRPMVMVKLGSLIVSPKYYEVSYDGNTTAGIASIFVASKEKVAAQGSELVAKYEGYATFEIQKKKLVIMPDSFTVQKEDAAGAAIQTSSVYKSETNTLELTASAFGYAKKDAEIIEGYIKNYFEFIITKADNTEVTGVISEVNKLDYSKLEAGIYNIRLQDYVQSSEAMLGGADSVLFTNNYDISISSPAKLVVLDANAQLNLKNLSINTETKNLYQNLFAKYGTQNSFAQKLAAAMSGAEKYCEGILKTAQKIQSYWAKLSQCSCDDEAGDNDGWAPGLSAKKTGDSFYKVPL